MQKVNRRNKSVVVVASFCAEKDVSAALYILQNNSYNLTI